jgi:hypothetical protein
MSRPGTPFLPRAATRRVSGKRVVCVTCHDDVEAWLCPDWVVEMPAGTFARKSLRRPPITLEVGRVHVRRGTSLSAITI